MKFLVLATVALAATAFAQDSVSIIYLDCNVHGFNTGVYVEGVILKSVGNRVDTVKKCTHINKIHPESTPNAIVSYKNFDGEKDSTSSKHSLHMSYS